MPLGSASKTLIQIDFTRAQGVNSSGRITFQPPRVRVGTTMLSRRKVTVPIANGIGEVELVRLPAGTYHVREEIDGRDVYEFDFSLPLSSAATIQYEEIAPVDALPVVPLIVRSVNGVFPDATTGNVVIETTGGGSEELNDLEDVALASELDGEVLVYDLELGLWVNRYLTAEEIGAAVAGHTHTPAEVGSAPADHTHTPASIGASPADHTHTPAAIGASPAGHTHTPAEIGAATASHSHDPVQLGDLQPQLDTRITELVDEAVEVLDKNSVGLGSVDNTSDMDKPISTAVQAALDALPEPPPSVPPDRIVLVRDRSKTDLGNFYSLPSTGSSWVIPATLPEYTIQATVGDYIEVSYNYLVGADASAAYTDLAVVTGPHPHTIRRYLVSGDATPTWQGSAGNYPTSDGFQGRSGTYGFIVEATDLESGFVRLRWAIKSSTADATLYANNNYPLVLSIRNTRLSGS